jgi:hypothetical protein
MGAPAGQLGGGVAANPVRAANKPNANSFHRFKRQENNSNFLNECLLL